MSPRPRCAPALALVAGLAGFGCAEPEPTTVRFTAEEARRIASMSPVPPPPPDPTNRFADDPDAAALGAALFFDPGLSGDGRLSCASCHQPDRAFTDGRKVARGVAETRRNTPTVVGAAWSRWLFWDGRKDSAWSQALGPIEAPEEMGSSRTRVVRHLARAYGDRYRALFGPLPDVSDDRRFPDAARPDADPSRPEAVAWAAMAPQDREAVDAAFAHVGKALAAYERRLAPSPAPFDRFAAALAAGDPEGGGHLDLSARRGLKLFVGEAGCFNCHHGPRLTDDAFHNLGLPLEPGQLLDVGRGLGARQVRDDPFNCASVHSDDRRCDELRYLDPDFPDFVGAFRTPTLRDVERTGPYMHSGQFSTLREVLEFYNALPGAPLLGHRELTLQPLHRDARDLADLEAFLRSLTGSTGPDALSAAASPPAGG